tara:strand:- start:581 stop:1147 length:567 start_codon:yes stop_codon:yes gene_type:complete
MEYYYSTNGNDKNGPLSFDELKQKNITSKTLIWHEELDDWKMAGQLPELKNLFKKTNIALKKKESVLKKSNIDKKPETNKIDTLVVNEKQKMFSNPFSFNGRIRRLEYGITLIIMYIGIMVIVGMAEALEILGVLIIPMYWAVLSQGTKRCHDLGRSGWYQLIPYYFFWMLFAKGDDGINEYGPNPKM